MAKLFKIFLFVLFPLFLLLGAAYGLAKIGALPVRKLGQKNPALKLALHAIGLDSPKLPARQVTPSASTTPDPLEGQRKALEAQRADLEKQRAVLESQHPTQVTPASAKTPEVDAAPDPKSITRLAAVYEQMPPETVTKIFAKLPDLEVIAILRKMDEKQVGLILAAVPPDHAATLTLSLSKPAVRPPDTQ